LGILVAAGGGLAGHKNEGTGGALSGAMGEGLKNPNYSAISGKDPGPNDGHGGKRHDQNNQYATQVRPTFPINCRRNPLAGLAFWTR